MPSRTVTVGAAVGLHARPAALIAKAASGYDSEVTLAVGDDEPVNAASSLMIMTLGAENGTAVTVSSEDPAAVEEIAAMIERDLDAE